MLRSPVGSVLCGRLCVLVLGAGAVICSIFCLCSCQFFSYRSLTGIPWEGLNPPFDTLTEASVGFFRYSEVTTRDDNHLLGDFCKFYDDWNEIGQAKLYHVAQWCSIMAPLSGFLAWIQVSLEFCCCRLRGGIYFVYFFYFTAFALQASTFLTFFDTEFCFEAMSDNQCKLEIGAWYSLGSTLGYLVLTILSLFIPSRPGATKGLFVITRGYHQFEPEPTTKKSLVREHQSDTSEEEPMAPKSISDFNDEETGGVEDNIPIMENRIRQLEANASNLDDLYLEDEEEALQLGKSTSSGTMSSVLLNSPTKIDEARIKKLQQDRATMGSIREGSPTTEETSKETVERSRDFLDVCCAGDPLQLEKGMGFMEETSIKGTEKGSLQAPQPQNSP